MFDVKSPQSQRLSCHQPPLAKTMPVVIFARSRQETGRPSALGLRFVADVKNALKVSDSCAMKQNMPQQTNVVKDSHAVYVLAIKITHAYINSVNIPQMYRQSRQQTKLFSPLKTIIAMRRFAPKANVIGRPSAHGRPVHRVRNAHNVSDSHPNTTLPLYIIAAQHGQYLSLVAKCT